MTAQTAELRVRFSKRSDGVVTLQCVRKDGSVTWQRHDKHGVFFSFHDLSHFAVETVLGFRQGFYGLLADGWDITDTTGKGPRGLLTPEAILVEHIVNLLSQERSGGAPPLSADDFNSHIQQFVDNDQLDATRTLSEAQLLAVRQQIETLRRDWADIPAGASLELTFHR